MEENKAIHLHTKVCGVSLPTRMKADLHIHSTCSDGFLTPKQVVETATKKGIIAFALTDHDTINGIAEARKHYGQIKGKKPEFVAGAEITCDEPEKGFIDVHLLGLFIDEKAEAINRLLEKSKKQRIEQKKDMIKKLNELGFEINFEDALKFATGEIGRPHVAEALIKKYPNKFATIEEAFKKYLAKDKPGFVPRKKGIRIREAVEAIKESKGIPILAHPGVYNDKEAMKIIDFFKSVGGQGIETVYPYDVATGVPEKESKRKIRLFNKAAEDKKLLKAGGTDYHGEKRKIEIGEMGITKKEFEELKKGLKTI